MKPIVQERSKAFLERPIRPLFLPQGPHIIKHRLEAVALKLLKNFATKHLGTYMNGTTDVAILNAFQDAVARASHRVVSLDSDNAVVPVQKFSHL